MATIGSRSTAAASPNFFVGARIGLDVAWVVLVAAEPVAATSGLGFMIENVRNCLKTEVTFVGLIAIGCMGTRIPWVRRLLQRRMIVWY